MLETNISFKDLGLKSCIVNMLTSIGYNKPLPIQEKCIPLLLKGYDMLGMANTGSGKTAAFLLPLLQKIDIKNISVQGLIITPTRELAIQVGQVCSDFTKFLSKIKVTTVYGGQNFTIQLRALKKNPHIIVGTPGRLLDHINRRTINISSLKILIVDEADEMLKMGFIEDIEKIISKIPRDRQTVFFSATLPMHIRKISYKFMHKPKEVYINEKINNVCVDIKQSYCLINEIDKNEVLIRFLETENFDAAIIFVNTKYATLQIAEILGSKGYNSAPLNGDMDQCVRYQTVSRLRGGTLDILVTTDVAARGLDIHRIGLVINYDIPNSYDAYVHRIGRTGRAGRFGRSVLFVKNKEYKLLHMIRKKVNSSISKIQYPTSNDLMSCRLIKFTNKVADYLGSDDLNIYKSLLSKISPRKNLNIECLAAILLKIAQGDRPLVLSPDPIVKNKSIFQKKINTTSNLLQSSKNSIMNFNSGMKCCNINDNKNYDVDVYRILIGYKNGARIQNITKAILNKIDLRYYNIGDVKLFSSYSIVEILKFNPHNNKFVNFSLSNIFIFNKKVDVKFLKHVSFKKNKICDSKKLFINTNSHFFKDNTSY